MPSQSSAPTSRELLHAKLDALLDECDLAADNAEYGQTFDGSSFAADGRVVAVGASEPNGSPLLVALRRPVESHLEKLQLNFYTPKGDPTSSSTSCDLWSQSHRGAGDTKSRE